MRRGNFPCRWCGLTVFSPFAKFHPCKNRPQQIIFGDPVTVLFSFSQMTLARLNLRRQLLRSFPLSLQKKNWLINVASVFNYVESQAELSPFLGFFFPARSPPSPSERSWLLFMVHPFKCLKSRLSTQWPTGLEGRLQPPGWEEGSGILPERSLHTLDDKPSMFECSC